MCQFVPLFLCHTCPVDIIYGVSRLVGSGLVTIIDVIPGLLMGVYLGGGPWFVLGCVVKCDGCGFKEGAILDLG